MNAPAQAINRSALRRYGVGLAVVLIATGLALIFPDQPAVLAVFFVIAAGAAAALVGSPVGYAATAVSLIVAAVLFEPGATALLVIGAGGAAASFALGRRRAAQQPGAEAIDAQRIEPALPPERADEELASARAAAERSQQRRLRLVPYLMYVGLPLLVLVTYTNISDILIRHFGVPSLLQPLVLLLAIPIARYHDDFRPASIALQPLTILLAAYCLVVFASSNWAWDTSLADQRLSELVKSLLILVVAASLSVSWSALRAGLAALVAGAAFFGVLTIIQAVVGDPSLQFGGLVEIQEGHLYGDVYEMRPGGPVGDPNVFGQILLIALPIAVFLAISSKVAWRRWAYAGASLMIAAATLLTYSRGVMLALGVVVVLTAWILRARLVLVLLVLAVLLPTDAGRRLLTIQEVLTAEAGPSLDPSIEERRVFASVAMRMFGDHLVAGVGAGNYTSHYWPYAYEVGSAAVRYDPPGKREQPHSLYLEIASETGLLGLLVFGCAMLIAVAAMYQSRAALLRRGQVAHAAVVAGIGIALVGYLSSAVFLHAGLQRYLWLILGFAVAAARLTTDPPSGVEEPPAVR